MRVVDAVDDDLAPAGIGHDVALGYLENRRAPEVARSQVGVARGRSIQHAAEMRPRALADDQDRALGEEASNSAGVVHVMMRQHHPADRLAGEFFFRGVHHP